MSLTLDDLLPQLHDGYIEVDPSLLIVRVNAAAESLFRLDRSQILGQPLEASIAGHRRSEHWPALLDHIRSGRSGSVLMFYPEQYTWHEVRVVPGSEGGVGLLIRDVTDRQWLIRREAERFYLKSIFENAPVAITILRSMSPRGLTVEYMNETARKLVGDRNIIGLPLREAIPELKQRELLDIVERVHRDGIPYIDRNVLVEWDRDGDCKLESTYLDVAYQPIQDFDGTRSGVLSVAVEVTRA